MAHAAIFSIICAAKFFCFNTKAQLSSTMKYTITDPSDHKYLLRDRMLFRLINPALL